MSYRAEIRIEWPNRSILVSASNISSLFATLFRVWELYRDQLVGQEEPTSASVTINDYQALFMRTVELSDLFELAEISPAAILETCRDRYAEVTKNCSYEITEGCPHADLMAEYARDAKRHPRPWELWEFKSNNTVDWCGFNTHPGWKANVEYRRKVKNDSM